MLTFFTLWKNVVAFITFFRFTKTELSTIRGVVTIKNWEYPHFFFALIIKTFIITISSAVLSHYVYGHNGHSLRSPRVSSLYWHLIVALSAGTRRAAPTRLQRVVVTIATAAGDPATELVFVWVWGAGSEVERWRGELWGSHFCGEGSVISSRYI